MRNPIAYVGIRNKKKSNILELRVPLPLPRHIKYLRQKHCCLHPSRRGPTSLEAPLFLLYNLFVRYILRGRRGGVICSWGVLHLNLFSLKVHTWYIPFG